MAIANGKAWVAARNFVGEAGLRLSQAFRIGPRLVAGQSACHDPTPLVWCS